MLPNLIVIGAAKCGTTSLHEYLDLHPEIAMSREKELNFFVAEKNLARGLEWYESNFEPAPVRGESSPPYSVHPLYSGVAERMRRTIRDAKLIYLVRDPIERVVSHYLHRTVNWPEMGSLEETLEDPDLREWFVVPSRYWLQLEQYLAHFPEEQVRVFDADDLRTRRSEVLGEIFAFLGVDAAFTTPAFERAHNEATGQTRKNRAGRLVAKALETTLGAARSQTLRARAPTVVRAPFRYAIERPVLRDEVRDRLATELQEDVARLRAHTGLPFASWSL